MSGWIKIHRSLLDKSWAKRPGYMAVWLYLLLQASHKQREEYWNGRLIQLMPGQLITGRLKIAQNTGEQQTKVERILKCFESEQQIEQQTSNTSRLISICNWHIYQNSEQPNEQQMNNKRTTDEQRMNTIQEVKNIKKERILSGLVGEKERCEKFVDFVNQTFSRKYQATKKVHEKFNARILKNQYDPQTLLDVVNNIKLSTFHISNNFGYATPEYILREDTIEKFKHAPIIQNSSFQNPASKPPPKILNLGQ